MRIMASYPPTQISRLAHRSTFDGSRRAIPLPPLNVPPCTIQVNHTTLVSGITAMSVSDALTWYQSALTGTLKVPKKEVRLETLSFAPEPAMGRLVLAKELPFETPSCAHFQPWRTARILMEGRSSA